MLNPLPSIPHVFVLCSFLLFLCLLCFCLLLFVCYVDCVLCVVLLVCFCLALGVFMFLRVCVCVVVIVLLSGAISHAKSCSNCKASWPEAVFQSPIARSHAAATKCEPSLPEQSEPHVRLPNSGLCAFDNNCRNALTWLCPNLDNKAPSLKSVPHNRCVWHCFIIISAAPGKIVDRP